LPRHKGTRNYFVLLNHEHPSWWSFKPWHHNGRRQDLWNGNGLRGLGFSGRIVARAGRPIELTV